VRVLVVHSRYLSGPASGENRVVADEARLLREAGHEVDVWERSVERGISALRQAGDAIWSLGAARELGARARVFAPDVVHLHSVYPRLSPAVLRAVPRESAVVMTLHNFRLMCLPATYERDGAVCEDCAGRLPWRGVVRGCYRASVPASAVLATSLVVHRAAGSFRRVDRYLAVSAFVREKYVEAGFDPASIGVKSNFSWPSERRAGPGGPLLFLGRLEPEKGLDTVIRALPADAELIVAGDGAERARLERLAGPNVRFLGVVEPAAAAELVCSARALVVPSRWYEAQPRAILEAFAAGVPVLASGIGGLPELVDDGVNGRLFPVDDAVAWAAGLDRMRSDAESAVLGDGAFSTWRERFTPEEGLRRLEAAYAEAIARREPVAERAMQPRPSV
jgi:glycosyltransferase involved in cell wall biosynthesis